MESPRAPFGYGNYAPPEATGSRPAVIMWFRVYAAMMTMLYVVVIGLWMFLAPSSPNVHTTREAEAQGMIFLLGAVCLLCGAFFATSALVPFRPWGWTLGLVAICVGLTSCSAVVAIPLFIYWIKPETKAAFGRL